jgi:hypothetical protein
MRSTRAHAAAVVIVIAIVAAVCSLLLPSAAWHSLLTGGHTQEARVAEPLRPRAVRLSSSSWWSAASSSRPTSPTRFPDLVNSPPRRPHRLRKPR